MNIFMTGAAGFIGNKLARNLANRGNIVHALVRKKPGTGNLEHPNIRVFDGDVNDISSVEKAMLGCDQVYHCAAYAKLWANDPQIFYKVNVGGTKNVLEMALQQQVEKMVFTSSTAVMGPSLTRPLTENDPRLTALETDYEISKLMAEQQVHNYVKKGLFCMIVSPSRVYGPGELSYSNAISRLLLNALKGKLLTIPAAGETLGNYVFVDDVVEGHIKAMQLGEIGERYILGGENASCETLVATVRSKIKGIKVLSLPQNMLKAVGYIQVLKSRLTGTAPAFTPSMLSRYFCDAAFSSNKAERNLGYTITPLDLGIEKTISYLKTQIA